MFEFAGILEFCAIILIALVVLGPKDMIVIAYKLGKFISKIKVWSRTLQINLEGMAKAELEAEKKDSSTKNSNS